MNASSSNMLARLIGQMSWVELTLVAIGVAMMLTVLMWAFTRRGKSVLWRLAVIGVGLVAMLALFFTAVILAESAGVPVS